MDAYIKENKKEIKNITDNYSSLNTNSTLNTEIIPMSNNKIDNLRNIFSKIITNQDPLNLKFKYFNRWKICQKKSNLRSIKIFKFENKRIKFDIPTESSKKNEEKKKLLEGKINIKLFERLVNKQNDKLKYFFEKWKILKYKNKSRNYNFKKREIKKIKILPKKKNPEILYPKKGDDIYNNIINILNKINKSKREKELLSVLTEIEDLEKNNNLKNYDSNDSINFEEGKNDNKLKNKISERAFKRIKNSIDKNDIKQKYFNRWKKLTTFTSKRNKSIKKINRIILTRKQKDPNLSDYDAKSYKTMDNINNLRIINKNEENELNNYVLPLYQKSDKIKKSHIKNTLLKILKSLEENKKDIQAPSTPFHDSSLSLNFIDINTDRSEEESYSNISMKSLSKRMHKRLLNAFVEKKDTKMAYFKRWKENAKLIEKKIIKRIVINKEEKKVILNRLMTSDIPLKNKKNEINNNIKYVKIDETFDKEINEQNPIKEKPQDIDKIDDSNNYLNNNSDLKELEKVEKNGNIDNNNNIINQNIKDKILLEKINNSEITPKKYGNSNHFRFSTDFNFDFDSSFEKPNKKKRYSATPGIYRMSFKKVFLTRSKTKNFSSNKKKSFNNPLKRIIKNADKKKLKKYFDIWKSYADKEHSDVSSDKEDEDAFEIIKINDIKFVNNNNKSNEKIINEENIYGDIKIKKSSLNGIYGHCCTENYINNKNKEESLYIYGNEKSKEISGNIQPHFSDFLKAMNFSIATFNLFTYYSQLHEILNQKMICQIK